MITETQPSALPEAPQPDLTLSTQPVAAPVPWVRLLPSLATAPLLYLCHFPVAWGWLGWVALVPLLTLVRSPARPRRVYLCALVAGLGFFVPALQWMRVAHPAMYATWLVLAAYCAVFFPVAIFLLRWLDRRTPLPLTVTVPVVWTALELFRAHFGTGFGWYFLGHTQHDWLAVIQIADLGGAYAVTLLVAAVNAILFESLVTRGWFRALFALPAEAARWGGGALALQAAAVLLLLGGSLGYGFWRLGQTDFEAGPRVALVQGNLPQAVRNSRHDGGESGMVAAVRTMGQQYGELTAVAVKGRPALIAWPETSFPRDWEELDANMDPAEFPEKWRQSVDRAYEVAGPRWRELIAHELNKDTIREARVPGIDVLLGLNAWRVRPGSPDQRLNSAVLLGANGRLGGRYDKVHRVPFGEYLPFKDEISLMKYLSPYEGDYSVAPGTQMTRFPLGNYHYGVLICYEDSDAFLARHLAQGGGEPWTDRLTRLLATGTYDSLPREQPPPADFLLNVSNDGWFDGTSEHEEHLAVCRFRAVECRRGIGRAVNMGISAVIDGNGRVLAPELVERAGPNGEDRVWELPEGAAALPVGRWAEFKKEPGVLFASIPLDRRQSLYARWGDWLPWGCGAVLVLALAASLVRRKAARPTEP